MNLVQDCIQVFSGKPLSYFKERQETLILELLERALTNGRLGKYRNDLREILEYVEANNASLGIWRDSEPYFPIYWLARSGDVQFMPYLLEVLKLYIGMKDIRKSVNLPDGFYRLTNVVGTIFEVRDGRLREAPVDLIWKAKDFGPNIFLPMNGLFTDVLGDGFYPRMNDSYDPSGPKSIVEKTVRHMREFSRDVSEDFQDAVWNLVLTTTSRRRGVKSMSMRSRYFGGIFFNPFTNDEYEGVELMVHEYIHHRCTLWWETKTPTGIPPDELYIVSPMTGDEIRASFMIHAFIIYVSAMQFYRFVQGAGMPEDRTVARRINRRVAHLSRNMPRLYRRLDRIVKKKTDMSRLLSYLMEVYEPLK
ncbi:MAG TPA: hypothetical protein VFX30_13220 [bacterium]|nr:hypothetical protein [bacterium]